MALIDQIAAVCTDESAAKLLFKCIQRRGKLIFLRRRYQNVFLLRLSKYKIASCAME